jgi:tripartite ATP-independent transporter DctP family solute receptor
MAFTALIRLATVGALCLCLPFAAAAQATRVLKFNHTDTPSGARHRSAEFFASKVAEYSAGRLRVLVFHSGQLGNDPQSLRMISEGQLDFTLTASGTYASLVPTLSLTVLPYLVTDYESGWRLYDESAWVRRQFDKLPKQGVRILATWEAGFRNFTSKQPLATPADTQNKKLRIFENEMLRWIVESMGWQAVVLPVTEVYPALLDGRVSGQENPIDTIVSQRFFEVAPHLTLTRHVYSPLPLATSEKLWQELGSADRAALLRASREAQALSRKLVRDNERQQLEFMRAKGVTIREPDLTLFLKAVEPVYGKARQKYGADMDALMTDAREASRQAAGGRTGNR